MKNVQYLSKVPKKTLEKYILSYISVVEQLPPPDEKISIAYEDPENKNNFLTCDTTYGDLIYAWYHGIFEGATYFSRDEWTKTVNWEEVTDLWIQGNNENRYRVDAVKKVLLAARSKQVNMPLSRAIEIIKHKVKERGL